MQSIFRLVGSDEDALTYALGYLVAYDPDFCAKLIRLLGVAPRHRLSTDYSVQLQEVTGQGYGRRDVVIEDNTLRIVLEAKIGSAEPSARQLLMYGAEKKVWSQFRKRAIVALTQVKLAKEISKQVRTRLSQQNIQFNSAQWHDIVGLVLSHDPPDGTEISRYLSDQFIRYVRRDYKMGYYDAEILIQDVNPQNAEIFEEGWMYVTSFKDKKAPLYFAPYFTRQNSASGISKISRVIDVAVGKLSGDQDFGPEPPSPEHGLIWRKGLEALRRRARDEGFAHLDSQLLFLDRPINLWTSPITKKGFNQMEPKKRIPSQIPKGFHLRFDELLGLPPK